MRSLGILAAAIATACVPLVLLEGVLAAQDNFPPRHAPQSMPPPPPPPDHEGKCCKIESVGPPGSGVECATPCDSTADCSGNWSPGSASPATCLTREPWEHCFLEPYSVWVPAWTCVSRECEISGQPGVQCGWIILFGEGYQADITKCADGSTICF